MARPYFLAGTVPLYLVGVGMAVWTGTAVDWPRAILGLALVWSVQLLTHFYNEFHDVEADLASGGGLLTGGSQALVASDVPRATARWLGRFAGLLAIGLTLLLVGAFDSGLLLVPIVAVAVSGGWAYSSPPLRLVARGLGEPTVVLLGSVLVPLTGFYLQQGTVDGVLLWPVLALVPLNLGLTFATAIPDIAPDRATGKHTLAVRLGPDRSAVLAAASFLLGCGVGTWTIDLLFPGASLLGLFGTALVVVAAWPFFGGTRAGDRQAAGRFALVVTAAFGTIAFVIAGVAVLGA